jgi:hypothetical protein
MSEALAVGDPQCLVGSAAKATDLHALLGGEHRGAKGAEDVVERRGAFAVGTVGSEPGEHVGLGELAQAMLGAVLAVKEDLGKLPGGEHAVLADQAKDGAVAVGEPAAKRGELVGHTAPPGDSTSARTRMEAPAGSGVMRVHAGHLRQEAVGTRKDSAGAVGGDRERRSDHQASFPGIVQPVAVKRRRSPTGNLHRGGRLGTPGMLVDPWHGLLGGRGCCPQQTPAGSPAGSTRCSHRAFDRCCRQRVPPAVRSSPQR